VTSATEPVLSVVVVIVSDTTVDRASVTDLEGCLTAVQQQIGAPPTEVIVPYQPKTDGIEALAARFPAVRFVPVGTPEIAARRAGSREHHDMLRAQGLAMARGALLALLEDHARPDPHWSANIVAAHQADGAAVGGAIENGVDRTLNWAVYFCDFAKYQNPLPAGDSAFASDANSAYKRSALESVRSLWQKSFHETVVNDALVAAGKKLKLSPDIVVYQHRSDLRLGSALYERFVWGRSYARTRSTLLSAPRRLLYALLSPLLPLVIMRRISAIAWQRRRNFGKFVRAAPLAALLSCGWSLGECMGYVAPRPGTR
jgi:glycosyl transferase family 2